MAMMQDSVPSESVVADVSPFIPMFEAFRTQLDEQQDRRERIIKSSRDITALSKKMIFALQRAQTLRAPLSAQILKDVKVHHDKIDNLFHTIQPDLQGSNYWRWQRQVSSGIQEYIEAISFQHYLTSQSLMTLDEARAHIPADIFLTEDDYLLGLCDLTGEIMRFAVTNMATKGPAAIGSGAHAVQRDDLSDLRAIRTAFESLDMTGGEGGQSPLRRDIEKKLEVMRASVEKVENAAYGMVVRGSERPKGWMPNLNASTGMEGVEIY